MTTSPGSPGPAAGPTAGPAAAASRPVRIKPAALEQKVTQMIRSHLDRAGQLPAPVILLRAEPAWDGPDHLRIGDRTVRVVACVSPLAVLEQVAAHTRGGNGDGSGDGSVLVVLTDRDSGDLGNGVLSHALRHQVLPVDPWSLVTDSFGVQKLDPRLTSEHWASEALLDAMPPGGWPRLPGTVLNRDVALRHLTTRRFGLERLDLEADDLDARALLRWSALPGAVESFGALRETERTGLAAWLTEQTGRPGRTLFALVAAGHGGDALALGLVCDTLWAPAAAGLMERERGRVDRYFGDAHLDDGTVRAFGDAARDVVTGLLAEPAGHVAQGVLDRAEELLAMFGAQEAARYSDVLRSGFDHRIGAVATALRECLRPDGRGEGPEAAAALALADAVTELKRHKLAGAQRHRVEQAEMAQRLVLWLARQPASVAEPTPEPTSEPAPLSVGDGIEAQIAEWGWVDLALGYVWASENVHPELGAAYRALRERVSERRRELDAVFARRLAAWAAAGSEPGRMLVVSSVLDRVVAPLLGGTRPVLLVVLDGMSAAVAAELAEELRGTRWEEYDPLGGEGKNRGGRGGSGDEGRPRRRGVVAALPTLTKVSRASLFAGKPTEGGQDVERKAFENHPRWQGRKVRLYHKDSVRGTAGEPLGDDLPRALSEPDTLVAVVLNTIDDALDHGRESADPGWRIAGVGPLRALLDHARYHGRAVILTSDHGHVLERGGKPRPVPDAVSARHRTGVAPAGDGEVELAGPHVVAPGNRVVALWDPQVRYAQRRAGYHGGASLAEVTVPLLAFLPFGAAAPAGWRALPDQRPPWWPLDGPAGPTTEPITGPTPPRAVAVPPRQKRSRRTEPTVTGQVALDLPAATGPSAGPSATGPSELVNALLGSEMFGARHGLTPRRVPRPKIAAALTALLDAGGVLPVTVVAERAGEHAVRAAGFVTTLRHIFNVDHYQVLSVVDDGRTVRLDARLLREQFGLGDQPGNPQQPGNTR